MAPSARARDSKWQCPACNRILAAKPLAGTVTKHANGRGDLCSGVGKAAVNLSATVAPKVGQGARARVIARKKTPKTSPRPALQIKPSARPVPKNRERPAMLPSKKGAGASSLPKNRMKDEDHWTFVSRYSSTGHRNRRRLAQGPARRFTRHWEAPLIPRGIMGTSAFNASSAIVG